MCLYTKYIKNKHYTPTKKNGGNVPECKDKRKLYVPVGCGMCIECRKKIYNNWLIRIKEEVKTNYKKSYYVTFTFSDESLLKVSEMAETTEVNAIAAKAVRLFLERWRKKFKKSVKHFLLTELGEEGGRIHLHGFIWSNESKKTINDLWGYGQTTIRKLNSEGAIIYVLEYILKIDENHKGYKTKIMTSPGLGKPKFTGNNEFNYDETKEYIQRNGIRYALPIYWRNLIYNEEQKQYLWEKRLNEGKRYVLGIEVPADTEKFVRLNKTAREKNKKWGYGDDTDNKEIKYYIDVQ